MAIWPVLPLEQAWVIYSNVGNSLVPPDRYSQGSLGGGGGAVGAIAGPGSPSPLSCFVHVVSPELFQLLACHYH